MGFYLTPVLNRVFPGSSSIDLAKLQRAIIDELHGDMMGDFYDLLRSPSTTDPGEFMLTTYVSRHPMV